MFFADTEPPATREVAFPPISDVGQVRLRVKASNVRFRERRRLPLSTHCGRLTSRLASHSTRPFGRSACAYCGLGSLHLGFPRISNRARGQHLDWVTFRRGARRPVRLQLRRRMTSGTDGQCWHSLPWANPSSLPAPRLGGLAMAIGGPGPPLQEKLALRRSPRPGPFFRATG